MNTYRHMIMDNSNTSEVEMWNEQKIAKELPQVFKISRAKLNGERSISVRRSGLVLMHEGKKLTWEKAHFIAAGIMMNYIRAQAVGEHAVLKITLPVGTVQLNEDMSEYVVTSLSSLLMKGWQVSL